MHKYYGMKKLLFFSTKVELLYHKEPKLIIRNIDLENKSNVYKVFFLKEK